MQYFVRFCDNSDRAVPIKITGQYGRSNLIGLARRDDGKSRVLFFDANVPMAGGDRWVGAIERRP